MKKRIIITLSFIIVIGIMTGCEKKSESQNVDKTNTETIQDEAPVARPVVEEVSSGPKAPGFTLTDINGKELKLSSYKGKVVILDIWDTWCPPCRKEIPDFVELQKQYGKHMTVIGLAIGREGLAKVKSFAKEYEINYPIAVAPRSLIESYGPIGGIPTTFVIDQKGRIVERFTGFRPKTLFEAEIKKLAL